MSMGIQPKEFTGRHMLIVMLCFFGTIITVNLIMALAANTSWSGFVVKNSYVASQQFNEKVAESRAQAALGWQNWFDYRDGKVSYGLRNHSGFPVDIESVTVTFRRPASASEDLTITLSRIDETGTFTANASIHDGIWIVEADADVGMPAAYKYVRRMIIRNGALQ